MLLPSPIFIYKLVADIYHYHLPNKHKITKSKLHFSVYFG